MNVIKPRKPVERKNDMYTTQRRRLVRSVISIVLLGWVSAAAAHDQHGGYSAGEPGNPRKPAREIVVLMNEMDYSPAVIEVKRGEQIHFVLRNVGTEAHEFLLATTAENLKHGEAMKKNPDMEHDEPNGLRLAAKKSGEILWKFSKAGTFEYACLIPTHRESGMVGKINPRQTTNAEERNAS
jgi:uncharacterized cupredoxin-like copper-binding protein